MSHACFFKSWGVFFATIQQKTDCLIVAAMLVSVEAILTSARILSLSAPGFPAYLRLCRQVICLKM